MSQTLPLTGGCNCGAVRYALAAPPLAVVACHCTSCRRQSGATFSVNLVVLADSMSLTGQPASWNDPDTESGQPLAREFCGTCGSPIRSVPASSPGVFAVKAGTLDHPDGFAPQMHIWACSRIDWVEVPAALPSFPKGPPAPGGR